MSNTQNERRVNEMARMFDGYQAGTVAAKATDIKAAGYEAVGLYLFRHSNYKEPLTRELAEKISAAGLYIVSVYEDGSPTSPGYFAAERGAIDGNAAELCAKKAGQPAGTPIYFTVDYDAAPGDLHAITAYFAEITRIWKSVSSPYTIGVYGSGAVCHRLLTAGMVSRCWLSQSRGFDGYESFKDSGKANIVQGEVSRLFGMDVDLDETNGDAGGWKIEPVKATA